ncbi:YceI family protein [Rhodohalobacter halophilus]|uniref:YceI family protein n=1 Tax=Rhodohalobacter halophilus TaxID=1812810 RepID=UPI00083F5796|nr:YceI family protein [Rhodohalobacter halophilus]
MKLLQISIFINLWIMLFTVAEGDIFSQDRFTADEEVSRLWIEGSSNVNRFDCIAHSYDGEAIVQDAVNQSVSLEVEIDVNGFDCGKRKMNNDMKDALKADQYPTIKFVFNNAESLSDDSYNILGELTVAGVTREISFTADGEILEDGRMRARGSKKIFMTDFNIEPPTGLFGLIKADDELTVHFDLTAKRI